MKKIIAIILSIVMLLSLAACGGNDSAAPSAEKGVFAENKKAPKGEPTEEELEQIRRYCIIMDNLGNLERGGEVLFYYEKFGMDAEVPMEMGQKALSLLYEQLTQLEAVDKWAGTQWADDPSINWDRQAVLDSFTVIEDVLLAETKTNIDFVGNPEDTSLETRWDYDVNGRLCRSGTYGAIEGHNDFWYYDSFTQQLESNPAAVWHAPHYYYDDQGRIEKIEYGSGEDVEAVMRFTYTGDRVASTQTVHAYGKEGNAVYTYDAQGYLAQIEYTEEEEKYKRIYHYEYDGRGNVLSEHLETYRWDYYDDVYVLSDELLTTYTYDDSGVPTDGVCKQIKDWNGQVSEMASEFVYTCDTQGRPVAVTVTCFDRVIPATGETVWEKEYLSCEVVIEYGDYYIYNPAQ